MREPLAAQALQKGSRTSSGLSAWRRDCVHQPPSPKARNDPAAALPRMRLEERKSAKGSRSGGPPIRDASAALRASSSTRSRRSCCNTTNGHELGGSRRAPRESRNVWCDGVCQPIRAAEATIAPAGPITSAKGRAALAIVGKARRHATCISPSPARPSHTALAQSRICLLYTSSSPRDRTRSRMPSSASGTSSC